MPLDSLSDAIARLEARLLAGTVAKPLRRVIWEKGRGSTSLLLEKLEGTSSGFVVRHPSGWWWAPIGSQ